MEILYLHVHLLITLSKIAKWGGPIRVVNVLYFRLLLKHKPSTKFSKRTLIIILRKMC